MQSQLVKNERNTEVALDGLKGTECSGCLKISEV